MDENSRPAQVRLINEAKVRRLSDAWIIELAFELLSPGRVAMKLGWEKPDGKRECGPRVAVEFGASYPLTLQVPADDTGPLDLTLWSERDEAAGRERLWEKRCFLTLNGDMAELTWL